MTAGTNPPPRTQVSPSSFARRIPVVALATAGCGVPIYLALYQYHVVAQV
jgi:hypothetical protein